MRSIRLWIAGSAVALAAPLAAQRIISHEAVSQTAQGLAGAEDEQVGFKTDAYERMTVPVLVTGAGPYRFLVDTGADRTAISSKMALDLKLEQRPPARIHTVTGVELVSTVRVPLLQLGRNRIERLDAPLLERSHMGADGILGVDSLRSQRVVFDFRSKQLSIVPTPRREPPVERGAIVVKAKAKMGHLILTKAFADGHRVNLIVDTGAEISIANEAMRRLLRMGPTGESNKVELLTVTGEELNAHYGMIDSLDIGGAVLNGLPVVFADAHIFRKLDLDDRPTLLLGMNAMRAFDLVSIDFEQKKLRLVLPQRGARTADRRNDARRSFFDAAMLGPERAESIRTLAR